MSGFSMNGEMIRGGRWQVASLRGAAGWRCSRGVDLLAVGCLMAAALPLLGWYVQRAVDGSDEPLGLAALAVALVLTGRWAFDQRRREEIEVRPVMMIGGAVLVALLQTTRLQHFPLIPAMLVVGVVGASVRMPRGKAGVMVLLLLSLPLVASLDFYAGYPLRLVATHVAVGLLRAVGFDVVRSGVLILDGGNAVGIDPPCAGVRMLWTACFTAAVVAARQGIAWKRTAMLLLVAVSCVVLGNGVRAALVFLPESGRVHWPEWAHPAVGLAVHGAVLAAVFGVGGRMQANGGRPAAREGGGKSGRCVTSCSRRRVFVMGILALVTGVFAWSRARGEKEVERGGMLEAAAWPATFDGEPLVPLLFTATEAKFAQMFPGQIGKFRCGRREIVLRRVGGATRYMHPGGHCLKAMGFEELSKPAQQDADGRWWGCSAVERGGEKWLLKERYENARQTRVCLDASAWFWSAVLHPDEGPWTAMTVMEPVAEAGAVSVR